MAERQKIRNPRENFTIIPNMWDDAALTVYEFRLLVHYKRVGDTYEATRTTAAKCGMGLATVVRARRGLALKGWVRLGESDKGTLLVEVVDRWTAPISGGDGKERSPQERDRSPQERGRSAESTEEVRFKKDSEEEGSRPTGATFHSIRKTAGDFFERQLRIKQPGPKHPNGPAWWWQPIMRMLDEVGWDVENFQWGVVKALERLTTGRQKPTIKGPISVEGTFLSVWIERRAAGGGKEDFDEWLRTH